MKHGTRYGYKDQGCRCEPCCEAYRQKQREYRQRARHRASGGTFEEPDRVPIEPISEHINRLVDSGWTKKALAAEVGVSESTISGMARAQWPRVARGTADVILALEPQFIDDVAVERLVRGELDKGDATPLERIAAFKIAHARWAPIRAQLRAEGTPDKFLPGESMDELQRRLGLNPYRVLRQSEAS